MANSKKVAAGRLGAKALKRKVTAAGAPRGAWLALMRDLGSRGGRAMWRKYKRVPVGTAQFEIVNRKTGEVLRVENRYGK